MHSSLVSKGVTSRGKCESIQYTKCGRKGGGTPMRVGHLNLKCNTDKICESLSLYLSQGPSLSLLM